MEKFQGPTNQCLFGETLAEDEGLIEEDHGTTGSDFNYEASFFNAEENFRYLEEQQQQQDSYQHQQSSISLSIPIIRLEDKMPFLEMLQCAHSPPSYSPYYLEHQPTPLSLQQWPTTTTPPHFGMLLTLQQQQKSQIPKLLGRNYLNSSCREESSSMEYYFQRTEGAQEVPLEQRSSVTTTTINTYDMNSSDPAHSPIKWEANKEQEQDQDQACRAHEYHSSLGSEIITSNNKNDEQFFGEPPNYSSQEDQKCRKGVLSPTTTSCCLAKLESSSPSNRRPKTQLAAKHEPPAVELVTTASNIGGGRGRKKRKRTRPPNKNREEVESQRMTHIAVERNRRRQMNDHLNALRSLMPSSFIQRGDQASIIGGAIDFVKELEQLLQSLQAQKRMRSEDEDKEGYNNKYKRKRRSLRNNSSNNGDHSSLIPFHGFFSSPQYTSYSSSFSLNENDDDDDDDDEGEKEENNEDELRMMNNTNKCSSNNDEYYSSSLGVDIEVIVVQTHVNLKILARKRVGQLVRAIVALEEDLRLSILHLNVTSFQLSVLYSFNLKIEDDCKLGTSADEIATAVYQIFNSCCISTNI